MCFYGAVSFEDVLRQVLSFIECYWRFADQFERFRIFHLDCTFIKFVNPGEYRNRPFRAIPFCRVTNDRPFAIG